MFLDSEYTMGSKVTETDEIEHILGIIMKQKYSSKDGLNSFGERGEHGVSSELNQLHNMETFLTIDSINLSNKYRA